MSDDNRMAIPDDADYAIGLDSRDYVHVMVLVLSVVLPLLWFVLSIVQSGPSLKLLAIVPVGAICYLLVRYTKHLASINLAAVEQKYDNMIIVEASHINNEKAPLRPKRINIQNTDGSSVPFAFVLRSDWQNKVYTLHTGVFAVKDNKVAVLVNG